jgi:hypothetical protein
MAVTYSTTVKSSRMTVVKDAIDAGAGNGILVIGTTGLASTLVSITLDKPSATISSGVLTFSGLPNSGTASGTGTAAEAKITDSTGTTIISGLTVGTTSTDIIIDSTSITTGQTVNFNATSTITHG